MWHKTAFLGNPGSGKTTMGLSYPGVEHHVFGSSEDTTAANFVGRTDILPPVRLDWYDTLSDADKAKFTDEKANELDIAKLTKLARAKNIARYRRYLYQIKNDLLAKKRPELQTLFLDNLTPFSQEFEDYVDVVWEKEFITDKGEYNSIAFYKRFTSELTDFLRLFMSLPCHTLLSCHVGMSLSEELSATTSFLSKDAAEVKRQKEWQPMLTGRVKYMLAGIPDWVFFLQTVDTPGKPTKHIAKLETGEALIGVAKPRIQPFSNPRSLEFGRTTFYTQFNDALTSYLATGQLVTLGGK